MKIKKNRKKIEKKNQARFRNKNGKLIYNILLKKKIILYIPKELKYSKKPFSNVFVKTL